ncbi:ABC transporter permease [Streptomyces sp. NPDC059629]|uniref:ABC transporter permease n=1 Tax=Streptomyces sp. NPDC059629 TaxID=3346889 RepID=UPI003687CF29
MTAATSPAAAREGSRPVRLSPGDVLRLGVIGLRVRKMRAALSALGISIGIATMIMVTGIPASSQKELLSQLTALGTNLLQAQPVQSGGQKTPLPKDADRMAARIGPVTRASAVANTNTTIQRTDHSDPSDSIAVSVLAARDNLLTTVNGSVNTGRFLTPATDRFPTVVLGHQAAATLGFKKLLPGQPAPQVVIDHRWFTVIGVLNPMPLTSDLEQAALVGWSAAGTYLHFDGHPTVVYVKSDEQAIDDVRSVLPATLNPELPGLVQVSRPSDALAAKRASEHSFSGLFIGLAGVALLVGGIGVANTMIISVLERRREIGLRRALGANRGQIRGQFLTEAVVLSGLGGLAGAAIGSLAVAYYATYQGWPVVIPPASVAEGVVGALLVGVVAGVYPSIRAARLPPTEALATV